jgi:AraC family transcriptional regulator
MLLIGRRLNALEWLERMTNAIDYMEEHMEDPFDAAAIAKIACSSTFHFQRMFHMLTGITVAEYVRKRKLTLAAQELAATKVKVIDVALKYGYDTPESFSKAFSKAHGISPSAAREQGAKLKAQPRISFQLSLKGDKDMDYRIVEKDKFKVVGKEIRVTTKNGENFKRIPKFWEECHENGSCEKLCNAAKGSDILGICKDFGNEELTYMIAVEKPEGFTSKDMTEVEIPAATWAVFESVGPTPDSIQKVWKRIFSEWFPATNFEHADAPELEVYPSGDPDADNYRCEVWIPIVRK